MCLGDDDFPAELEEYFMELTNARIIQNLIFVEVVSLH